MDNVPYEDYLFKRLEPQKNIKKAEDGFLYKELFSTMEKATTTKFNEKFGQKIGKDWNEKGEEFRTKAVWEWNQKLTEQELDRLWKEEQEDYIQDVEYKGINAFDVEKEQEGDGKEAERELDDEAQASGIEIEIESRVDVFPNFHWVSLCLKEKPKWMENDYSEIQKLLVEYNQYKQKLHEDASLQDSYVGIYSKTKKESDLSKEHVKTIITALKTRLKLALNQQIVLAKFQAEDLLWTPILDRNMVSAEIITTAVMVSKWDLLAYFAEALSSLRHKNGWSDKKNNKKARSILDEVENI